MIDLRQGDCLKVMKSIPDGFIDLTVTSPPYYNAREYSQWSDLDSYYSDMNNIFKDIFRVLKNHRYFVLNVGDIVSQVGKAKWATKKIPLAANFIVSLEAIGFEFIDDYIWDKGEVQSKRHLGNPKYPLYQYPLNCYEHIIVFRKNVLDKEKVDCPICNKSITVSNSQSSIGVQSWECKNPDCEQKSKSGRGKRFSKRSVDMQELQTKENEIEEDLIYKWRRDIVRINPVVKINNKGENILGHTAPYPIEIPDMAVAFFSGVNEIVYDPFMGSGTTGVACTNLNRRFIGIELDEKYFKIAKDRIDLAQQETKNMFKQK